MLGVKAVAAAGVKAVASGVNELQSNLGEVRKLVQKNANLDQKKEYQVQVTIIEARGLTAKDKDGSDPYIRISVGNLPPQSTSIKQNTSTVVFNQSFTFKDLFLNNIELENQEILIQAIDQNQFAMNPLIGQYSIGLSTLYRSNNHEFFKTWLDLIHPDFGIVSQGYLLVSCYIIGTDDRPPVHDINEANEDNEERPSYLNLPEDVLTEEQRKKKEEFKRLVGPIGIPERKQEPYQLLVSIVKGEDLPILSGSTCDSFVSCRVCGNPLRTPTMKNSQKPNYQTKMVFPAFYPVYNDKIVIRRTIRSDTFIACIPENPNENDWFNINTLHSRGGTMSYRWFHLYGIPLNERPDGIVDEVIKKLAKQIEGTWYMGRILLSLSLSPNEKAGFGLQPLGGYKEPPIAKYIVRCDTFELQSSFDCGEYIMIDINFGGKSIRSNLCKKRSIISSEKSKTTGQKQHMTQLNQYTWKDMHAMIENEIQIDIPQDYIQQPDFIVSLYSVKPSEKNEYEDSDIKRLAYLRIKPDAPTLENEQPKWFQMRPVQYKTLSEIHSRLLMNIELKTELVAKQKKRHQIKRSLKSMYLFKGFFWGAYDLCPSEYSENVLVRAYLQIGPRVVEVVSGRRGNNVIWNSQLEFLVELEEKLEFSSNIIATFYNRVKRGMLGQKQEEEEYIGQFAIKAESCEIKQDNKQINAVPIDSIRPSYSFHHITHEGKSNGRILSSFQIFKSEKTFQNAADMQDAKHSKILGDDDFKLVCMQFPLIGVRNLPEGIREPEFVFRVPQPDLKFEQDQKARTARKNESRDYSYEQIVPVWMSEEQEEQLKVIEERSKTVGGKIFQMINDVQRPALKNFNFCTIIQNPIEYALKIPMDLQFVPILEIEVREKNPSIVQTRYHAAVNLIEYVPWGDTAAKQLRIEFFEVGKFNVQMLDESDQGNINKNYLDLGDMQAEGAEQDSRMEDFNDNGEINGGGSAGGQANPNMIFDDDFRKEVDYPLETDSRNLLTNNSPNKNEVLQNSGRQGQIGNLDEESSNELIPSKSIGGGKSTTKLSLKGKSIDDSKSVVSSKSGNSMRTSMSGTSSMQRRILETQKQFKQGQVFQNAEFNPSEDFMKTDADESILKSERDALIKELSALLLQFSDQGKKDDGQKKQIIRKIEELKNYEIKENIFLEQDEDSQQENFNYGREVIKLPFAEQLEKGLPYKKFSLFRFDYSNAPTKAVVKGHLRLIEQEVGTVKEHKSEMRKTAKSSQGMRPSVLSIEQVRNQKNDLVLARYDCEGDDKMYPFDIFKQTFLNFFRIAFELKTRVYIMRCTNISAQASKIELYHLLAGEEAVCSASSFPSVFVGDGENKGRNIIKNIKDDGYVISDTLNPEFFKMYELDACLPEDWNLVVQIFNKGTAVDSLIGQFEIDLEDRVLGLKDLRRRIAYMTYIEYFKDKIEEYKYNQNTEGKKKRFEIKINELITKMEALDRNLKLPIEYLELKHPQKHTCQGTIEFFLEPFPVDVARMIPPSIIEKPQPMEFEIRVIIWETFDIPISAPKPTVDIFLTVALDSTANIDGEEIVKETDVHFGSEDGKGVFNYRLKFPFVVPCPFPRLRISVSDFSTVGPNENLGETVITLKKVLKKLKEGIVFSMPTTKFKFQHPNFPGQDRGSVSLSIKIVNKQLAQSEPVGEGQEEPNNDPILEKPKEGRNATAFFKGTALDFSAWSFLGLRILKIFAAAFVSIVTTMILFVKPGILVK